MIILSTIELGIIQHDYLFTFETTNLSFKLNSSNECKEIAQLKRWKGKGCEKKRRKERILAKWKAV